MPNLARTLIAGAYVAVASSVGAADLAGQSIPAADAQAFLGIWAVAIDAQGQTFTMDVAIEELQGNVAAEISSELGTSQVQRISKTGENLVLSYSIDVQGQQVPVVMTLTTAAEGLNANIDFADGMYETTGKGTRK
jgi:hypothetical protein